MSQSRSRFPGREFLSSCVDKLPSNLHWVFLLLATPLVFFLAVWTPPFQSADEAAHFERAYQVAHGGFYGGTGAYVDSGIEQLHTYVAALPFNPKARFSPADRAGAESLKWTGALTYVGFPNTAMYAATGYLPQALGLAFGKAVGMGVMRTVIVTRLFNGAFAVLMSTFAVFCCRGGKLVMFAVLMLPMTLSLFASCSQDCTVIAATALAFALISKQISAGGPFSAAQIAALASLLLIVSLGRPPYAVLLMVLLTPGLLPRWRNKHSLLAGLGLVVLLTTVTAAWWLSAHASTQAFAYSNAATQGVVDARMQLRNILHHPGILATLAAFIAAHAPEYIAGMIGILGWLDTFMPAPYYLAMLVVLLAACFAELAGGDKTRKSVSLLLFMWPVATVAALFLIEYLLWTPVGDPAIYGIQGRYFIPLAIAAGIGLPHLQESPKTYRQVAAVVVLSQLLTLFCLPYSIMARYYK